MKPIIAMLVEIDNEKAAKMKVSYASAIEKSGGVPLIVPYLDDGESLDKIVSLCDGFCFTGGADVSPERYGEAASEKLGAVMPWRDKLEFSFMARALASGKPILSICRGMQLLNAALGGSLYQDIPSEIETEIGHRQKDASDIPTHEVKVIAGGALHTLTGCDNISVNSFHHQAIKTLGRGLTVTATAEDGIIEAVSGTGKQYIRAYQWHPERLYFSNRYGKAVFDDFISACGG